ncbi:nucleotidyltransferase domain-containing protein [Planococcus lenghuensis]|uniref:Aminoglycoside-2''-adenylyltransferase n=1 Tax=Planococcus lenghuensis TaxID=2213202 RepID=A0A1Q2KZH4_9BACL|nr:hypothetical protein [Planococcus lenghuensis]AQQ53563.1 hypothetical protein B0X71_11090 [Planococcus lenghuensis]
MRTDLSNWKLLAITEIYELFSETPVHWGITGGLALDMHLGRKSRYHRDIDVVIYRNDQQIIYQLLKNEWTLYKAKDGKLSLWGEGDFLNTVNDIWVSKDNHSPWSFQIMLMNCEYDKWIYRREKTIKIPKVELFSHTEKNFPYLKLAIQLLYKGGSSHSTSSSARM